MICISQFWNHHCEASTCWSESTRSCETEVAYVVIVLIPTHIHKQPNSTWKIRWLICCSKIGFNFRLVHFKSPVKKVTTTKCCRLLKLYVLKSLTLLGHFLGNCFPRFHFSVSDLTLYLTITLSSSSTQMWHEWRSAISLSCLDHIHRVTVTQVTFACLADKHRPEILSLFYGRSCDESPHTLFRKSDCSYLDTCFCHLVCCNAKWDMSGQSCWSKNQML